MKQKLFISYSSADEDKVTIVAKELSGSDIFDAVIIAADRQALKPLAQKVIDGIEGSWRVIPVLTEASIHTQWIKRCTLFSSMY